MPTSGQEVPHVSFEAAVEPVTASVLRPRRVRVLLRNDGQADVSLVRVEVRTDPDITSARRDLPRELLPCVRCMDPNRVEQQIPAGKEVEILFDYPRGSFWLPLRNLDLAVFEPGLHKLQFTAQAQNPVTQQMARLSKTIDIDMQAPVLSIMLGGAVGALILAVLRALYRLRGAQAKLTLKIEIREAAIAIVAGILVAFVLTFAGGLLNSRALGIQFAATSFKGGLLVGIFSYKIADLLASRLWMDHE